jgi:branched-chain amino acid transport system substrate-binding protein
VPSLGGSQLDRRQLLRMFGAAAVLGASAAAAAACDPGPAASAAGKPNGRVVRIGLVTPALGDYAKIGDDIQKGFRLYLGMNGGLFGGSTVDLRTAEEGPTPAAATAAVKNLLDDGVVAIAGIANPAALPAVAPMMLDAKVPLVCSNACPGTLVNPDFLWRASSMEGEAGLSLAAYARSEGPTAYLFYEDTMSAREEVAAFRAAFTDAGGRIVGDVPGKVAFASRLATAKAAQPSVVYAGHTGQDAAAFLDAYRTAGIPAKLIGPGTLTETADLSKLPELPKNVYTSMFYAADLDNAPNRVFVASYHKTYGVAPSSFAAAAYDSAFMLDHALARQSGAVNSEALNKDLGKLGQMDSPRGIWTLNGNRAPQQRWYLRQLRADGSLPANMVDTDLTVLS